MHFEFRATDSAASNQPSQKLSFQILVVLWHRRSVISETGRTPDCIRKALACMSDVTAGSEIKEEVQGYKSELVI
jgi:hypothetical protein